jgi:hypothetical protein
MTAKDTTIRQENPHLVQDVVARHRSRQVPLVRQDTPIDRLPVAIQFHRGTACQAGHADRQASCGHPVSQT